MNRTAFCGHLEHCASHRISRVITSWLGTSSVNAKDRMFGFELTYQDDSIYVYCHETQGRNSLYLIQGVIERAAMDSIEQLADLVRLAAAAGLKCVIDYTPVDSDDNPVGDEMTITPDQVARQLG